MPENARMKMFGASPSEVRQARNQQRQAASTEWANLRPWSGMVKAAANAGGAFGDVLGSAVGAQDPAMQEALQVEEVKREVMGLGLDFNDPDQRKEYLSKVEQAFLERNMPDRAEAVRQMAIAESHAERALQVDEQNAKTAELKAQIQERTEDRLANEPDTSNIEQYTLPDGSVVEAKKGSDEAARILSEGGVPYEKPDKLEKLARVVATGNEAVINAIQAQIEYAIQEKKGIRIAEDDVDAKIETYKAAGKARERQRRLHTIQGVMEDALKPNSNVQFGTWASSRAGIVAGFKTFFPDNPRLHGMIEGIMKMNAEDYNSVVSASKALQAELAAATNSGKASQMLLQVLELAGPAPFLTNDGLVMVTEALKRADQFVIDKADYALGLGDNEITRSKLYEWESKNYGNSKYHLTADERREIKAFGEKRSQIAKYYNTSRPLPTKINEQGTEIPDYGVIESMLGANKDTIFRYGGNFYKLNSEDKMERIEF